LSKELREGEKYLTLVNMNELMKEFQQSLIISAHAPMPESSLSINKSKDGDKEAH